MAPEEQEKSVLTVCDALGIKSLAKRLTLTESFLRGGPDCYAIVVPPGVIGCRVHPEVCITKSQVIAGYGDQILVLHPPAKVSSQYPMPSPTSISPTVARQVSATMTMTKQVSADELRTQIATELRTVATYIEMYGNLGTSKFAVNDSVADNTIEIAFRLDKGIYQGMLKFIQSLRKDN